MDDDIPRNLYRKTWVDEQGRVTHTLMPAGEPLLGAAACLVPTAKETRQSLLRIRRKFKVSRAQLAVGLGVGKDTLRRWETGERLPSTAARRLVQLVEGIFLSDQAKILGFGGLILGQIDAGALEKTQLELQRAATNPRLRHAWCQ
jgi:DNA-binding transcriptional regulator YiaG